MWAEAPNGLRLGAMPVDYSSYMGILVAVYDGAPDRDALEERAAIEGWLGMESSPLFLPDFLVLGPNGQEC